MKIYIASDHGGYELKNILVDDLKEKGLEVIDMGPSSLDPDDDYPATLKPMLEEMSETLITESEEPIFGIVIGRSGVGEAIVANRYDGIRAVSYYGGIRDILVQSRKHNDTNILSLGADFLSKENALEAVSLWLDTEFSKEPRHIRRISQIDE